MQVRLVRQPGGAMVVRVAGEVDQQAAPALQEYVVELLCLCYDPIVLDLTTVRFLDPAAITALITATRDARRAGATLCVVADHRAVLDPLRRLGATSALHVCPSVAAALAAAVPSGGSERPPPGEAGAPGSPLPSPSRTAHDPVPVRPGHLHGHSQGRRT
ncbi:STAS domain-containing protein [Pseudonocardia bannensis]|uniref:Anti-sigma factor antagonist n=1 Tax=Pseudonocardia bannensis TaxID=630973 RepID=A0A848DBE1_9PSEU|nr:STAS domain-containing protein [Pseudonocardia bannensis]NMH90007.1 STAS domain-containing protein [Pseudonocardia bannensis]